MENISAEMKREIDEAMSPAEALLTKYSNVYRDMLATGSDRQGELDLIVDQLEGCNVKNLSQRLIEKEQSALKEEESGLTEEQRAA